MPPPSNISTFSLVDYVVFGATILSTMAIGVYHSVRGNKSTEDFLVASRSMSPLPVALSLTATYISSISILGTVGEVYGHGIGLSWGLIATGIAVMIAANAFLPVLYPLGLTSINQYLELRFRSSALKKIVMFQAVVQMLMYLGICLYAPTLALASVTPYSSETYIVVLGVTVTLYSSFGGMKAVVWTDVLQSILMVAGVLVVTASAIVEAGGLGSVWTIATEHGRTDAINLSFGLHERHTIFNVSLMFLCSILSFFSFSQSTVQRIATMKNLSDVKLVVYISGFSVVLLLSVLYVTGLSIFAVYANCDPITLGYCSRKDQMFPYYVIDHLGNLKGVPGLFVAGLFSGTMSSISSGLNSLPAMLWTDFFAYLPFFASASEAFKTTTNKIISLLMGSAMIGLAFLFSKISGLIQATNTLMSIFAGPMIGMFVLGFCFPACGAMGAMSGLFFSMVFMTWLGIGARFHGMTVSMLPFSVSNCPNASFALLNHSYFENHKDVEVFLLSDEDAVTEVPAPESAHDDGSYQDPLSGFYGISYTLFYPIGCLVCITVGILYSYLIEKDDPRQIQPSVVLPCLRRFVGPRPPRQEGENNATFVMEENTSKHL